MISGTGKKFLSWHKNINPQGFNKILAEVWEIAARYFGKREGI